MAGEVAQPEPEQKPVDVPTVNPEAKQKAQQALEQNKEYIEYVEQFGTPTEKRQVMLLKLVAEGKH